LLLETHAMNGKNDDIDDGLDEDVIDDSMAATVVISEDGSDDDIGADTTIEIDIERLVAKLDASDSEDVHHRAEIRRKLEELREQREQELDSTFNFNLDED
jgi:hypothetical protein